MTLRAYIGLLRMEDSLYNNEYYTEVGAGMGKPLSGIHPSWSRSALLIFIPTLCPQAAFGAVRCYLSLHDKPLSEESDADEAARVAAMSVEDRKKYKLKKKKVRKPASEPSHTPRSHLPVNPRDD